MPRVSVIIPAYNAARTLSATLGSVLGQSFRDLEVIVVDDGSTDDTAGIARATGDPRVQVVSQRNSGQASARNLGVSRAASETIAFLDADDLWHPDKLRTELALLERAPDARATYSDYARIGPGDTLESALAMAGPSHPCALPSGDIYRNLLIGNAIGSGSNFVVRKEALEQAGGFRADRVGAEDWDLYLRVARQGRILCSGQRHVFYRQLPASHSSRLDRVEPACLLVVREAFESAPPELRHLRARALSEQYRYFFRVSIKQRPSPGNLIRSGRYLALHLWNRIASA